MTLAMRTTTGTVSPRTVTTRYVMFASCITGLAILGNVVVWYIFKYQPNLIAWHQWLSRYWWDFCFVYLVVKAFPVLIANMYDEAGYRIDWVSTPLLAILTVFMLLSLGTDPGVRDGWGQIVRYDVYALSVDFFFMWLLYDNRRDAEKRVAQAAQAATPTPAAVPAARPPLVGAATAPATAPAAQPAAAGVTRP